VARVGDGPQRVVFVHGVLDRGSSFDRVAALLAEEATMEWYDRRGYAGSLDAAGAPLDVVGHVEDLLDVLDGRPAVVVGHSFGGVTVLGAAVAAPDLVQAIVLYETGMAWAPGWDDTPLRSILWGEGADAAAVALMYGSRLEKMTADEQAFVHQEARAFIAEERSVRTPPPGWVAGDGLGNGVGPEGPYDVAALTQPLVYGHSEHERFAAIAAHLVDAAGAVTVELRGAGHNAHRTQPAPFANLVRLGITLAREAGDPNERRGH
jgi:pimeloyl-ACP methyl ester carboxylesterase